MTMKAMAQSRYGSADTLALTDVERPHLDDDRVLLRIRAASVNPYDWHMMRGKPYLVRVQSGLRRPSPAIRGVDVAGRVEAVGRDVTGLRPGDEVFGWCGGAFAEYAAVRETSLTAKPPNVTFEQAAATPMAAITAIQALRDKGGVEPGERVLIIGASGGVGTCAVQIAKTLGAHVTGVCSTRNVDMVRSIGADAVIDYTQDDFADGERRFDLILYVAGDRSLSDCRRALRGNGRLVAVGGDDGGDWLGPLVFLGSTFVASLGRSQKMTTMLARFNNPDLVIVRDLLAAGSLVPVIDRSYTLTDAAEAVRYVEQGHARGKVVVTP